MEIDSGFRIDQKTNRPSGTVETDKGVVHYSCNSPGDEVLEKSGILPIGDKFGIEKNEVLLIPKGIFEDRGKKVGTVEAEAILRDLTQENRKAS